MGCGTRKKSWVAGIPAPAEKKSRQENIKIRVVKKRTGVIFIRRFRILALFVITVAMLGTATVCWAVWT